MSRYAELRKSIGLFVRRQRTQGFAVSIAAICIFTGITSMAGVGVSSAPLSAILGGWVAAIMNVAFIASGALVFFGIGTGCKWMESSGFVLMMTSLVVRNLALILMFGLSSVFVHSYFNATALSLACLNEYMRLAKQRVIVEITPDGR